MAASKDTFEAKHFASNAFAAGVFRGTGADVTTPGKLFGSISVGPRLLGKVSIEPRLKGTVRVN